MLLVMNVFVSSIWNIPFISSLSVFVWSCIEYYYKNKVLGLDPAGTMRSVGSSTVVTHRNIKAHSNQISGKVIYVSAAVFKAASLHHSMKVPFQFVAPWIVLSFCRGES